MMRDASTDAAPAPLRHAQPNRGLLAELPDETMSDRWLRVKCDPVARCGRNNFEREGSALDWRKALPIGNGDFGAAILGYPDNYTFHIAKNDVWWDNAPLPDPYPDTTLAELRRRVAAGDATVKHDIRRKGGDGRAAEPVPTSCARLTLQVCRAGTFHNVKEYANMAQAIASTEFCVSQNGVDGGPFWIQSLVSRLEEVLAIQIRPPQDPNHLGMVRLELSRDPMEMSALARKQGLSREDFDRQYAPRAEADGRFGWFTMPLSGGDSYTVMIATDVPGMDLTTDGGDVRARGRPKDGPVVVYATVVSAHDAVDTVSEARRRLENALAIGYDTIRMEHVTWWQRFWRRSWVALPDGMSERSWYWGLYKAASSRRPGKVCPAYGAPWRKGNYLNWGSFTLGYEETKYNLGLLATNRAELLEPWIAVVRRAAERMKPATRKFFELPGIAFPFGMSFTGEPVGYPGIYNSTPLSVATGGEAVKCCWDYYDFTGDRDFLARVGYPLLKEVALFYRAYLQEDGTASTGLRDPSPRPSPARGEGVGSGGRTALASPPAGEAGPALAGPGEGASRPDSGRLAIFPSRYNEYDSWCEGLEDFMRNSVVDLAMFRQALRNAAAAARALGVDADLAADWDDARRRLAPYAAWPDGTWKPSEDWKDPNRFMFHQPDLFELWPVSVGEEVDAWHGPEELRRQAHATYRRWLAQHPLNTWDRCFPFIAAARMGDREYAAKILAHLQSVPEAGNLDRGDPGDFTGPDGHSPFAVDAGSAFPAEVVTEFLLQSHAGDIRLFPAAPLAGHYAFHSLRARGAFLVSSEFRDGKVPYVLIQSLRGNPCRVAHPFGEATEARVRDLDTGESVAAQCAEVIEFATRAGHLYAVERADCPLEQTPEVGL